jgi:hypothetical protein
MITTGYAGKGSAWGPGHGRRAGIVSEATSPARPIGTPGNWYARNGRWFVPAAAIAALCLLGALVGLPLMWLVRSSDPYRDALARARENPLVTSSLGKPIHEGFLVTGSIRIERQAGDADLAIPLSGPKAHGTLHATATRVQGKWTFSELTLENRDTGQVLNLLDAAPLDREAKEYAHYTIRVAAAFKTKGGPVKGVPLEFEIWRTGRASPSIIATPMQPGPEFPGPAVRARSPQAE